VTFEPGEKIGVCGRTGAGKTQSTGSTACSSLRIVLSWEQEQEQQQQSASDSFIGSLSLSLISDFWFLVSAVVSCREILLHSGNAPAGGLHRRRDSNRRHRYRTHLAAAPAQLDRSDSSGRDAVWRQHPPELGPAAGAHRRGGVERPGVGRADGRGDARGRAHRTSGGRGGQLEPRPEAAALHCAGPSPPCAGGNAGRSHSIMRHGDGRETPLFAPFIYKMHHFTKTGSGQT
jgi:hypothetical protein